MLVNSDRFLLVSNQGSYFNGQKELYKYEIKRLNELLEKTREKKRAYKKQFKDLTILKEETCNKLESEILYLKQNIYSDKKEIEIQTDVDSRAYGELQRNNDLIVYHKKLVLN